MTNTPEQQMRAFLSFKLKEPELYEEDFAMWKDFIQVLDAKDEERDKLKVDLAAKDLDMKEDHAHMLERLGFAEAEIKAKDVLAKELVEALKNIEKNDKTFYDYAGKNSLTRDGASPESGTCYLAPREIAKEALAKAEKAGW